MHTSTRIDSRGKFKQIDNEMFEAFTSKFNLDILESMQDLGKNECQKEELKSVEIWKRKQSWLERYANFAVIFMLTKINFGLNLFGNTGISLSSHVS
jgi:hypothetical protein